jgi:GlpG protein
MRLINSTEDLKKGAEFSSFLTRRGIQNQMEIVSDTDWGSSNYGVKSCKIWIIDEDQVAEALQVLNQFLENPNNPEFFSQNSLTPINPFLQQKLIKIAKTPPPPNQQPLGKITLFLLITCTLIFLFCQITTPDIEALPKYLPSTPLVLSPLNKTLLYDYPLPYELTDKLVNAFGLEKLQNGLDLPKEATYLIKRIQQTPYWKGFYPLLINYFKQGSSLWDFPAPLFEKIKQGEAWRLISPIFLHGDIFHLFFNMVWLAVVGKQMERKIGPSRYIFFIIITAIFTNTIQYLMSGSNFIGFSGVLCAMITFVWIRQKNSAWEGYLLQKSTFSFIMIFIFGIFAIELFSFFLEINGKAAISPGIANAAHISGLVLGAILGRLSFFKIRGL